MTALQKDPGFLASAAVHGAALVFLLVNFAHPPKLEPTEESVAVEMVTPDQLNQISAGEKTAKQMPVPQRRVDKVSERTELKPQPPLAEAKKDVPVPPSPDKMRADPGEDDKPEPVPPQRVAALPPTPEPTPREAAAMAEPTPPQRPAPTPKVVEDKPPPPDAETIEPKPVPRPKVEPKKDAKAEAKPEPKPVPKPPEKKPPVKEAKTPTPPKKTEPRFRPDELAKLLDEKKDPKPAVRPRSGSEAKDQPHRAFDPHSISALLDHEAPQRTASTGQKLTQVASLGLPNAHAATLSPSMMSQLDQILIDQYRNCWDYFGLGQNYVPQVRVHLARDGTLVGQPQLMNPPSDPNLRSLAESAMRAVHKCNPLKIPDRFMPYYESWALQRINFSRDM